MQYLILHNIRKYYSETFFCNASAHYKQFAHYEKNGCITKIHDTLKKTDSRNPQTGTRNKNQRYFRPQALQSHQLQSHQFL